MSDETPAKDWELCRAMYLRGSSRAEIITQTGVTASALDRRITRGGWRLLRDRVPVKVEKISIEQRRVLIREGLAADLQESVQQLPDIKKSTNLETALTRAQLVSILAGTSEKVVGQMEKPFVLSIALLQSAADSAKPLKENIIDVASEVLPEAIP